MHRLVRRILRFRELGKFTRCNCENIDDYIVRRNIPLRDVTILPLRRSLATIAKRFPPSSVVIEECTKSIDDYFNGIKEEHLKCGLVDVRSIVKLIDIANDCATPLTKEQSLFLLENFSNSEVASKPVDLQCNTVFDKIWEYLIRNDLLTKTHVLAAINAWRRGEVPLRNIQDFVPNEFKDDIDVYEGLVYLACEFGDIERAKQILTEMKGKNLPINVNVFNALILGYSRGGDLPNCESTLEAMKAANMEPNENTQAELVLAYIENDAPRKAEKLLSANGHQFSREQILRILRTGALKGYGEIISQAVPNLISDSANFIDIPFDIRTVCVDLVRKGHYEAADLLINCLPVPEFHDNQDMDTFATFFLYELIKCGVDSAKIIDICWNLMKNKRNARALHVATEIALRTSQEEAIVYLRAIRKNEGLRSHYFWPLIIYNFEKFADAGVMDTLKEMTELNVDVDFETMSAYILPRLRISLKNPQQAIKSLERCGLTTSQILTPLISHLIFQQKFNDIIRLAELYPSKLNTEEFINPLAKLFYFVGPQLPAKTAQLLGTLQSKSQDPKFDLAGQFIMQICSNPRINSEQKKLSQLVRDLRLSHIKISPLAGDILSNHLDKFSGFEKSNKSSTPATISDLIDKKLKVATDMLGGNIIHPRDMSREDLENHLVELEAKGMNTRGVMRRLLQVCVREGKLERALEIKKKCDEFGVNISPGMLASTFDLFVKLKDVDQAEKTYNQIKKLFPGFHLDLHKVIDFCSLLAERDRISNMKEVLHHHASSQKMKNNEYLQKNLWNLLTSVANSSIAHQSDTQQSDESINAACTTETREILLLLQKLNYCSVSNTLLGPVIRELLLKNDIRKAVDEYVGFAAKEKKTPLQLELVTHLVRLSNGENLEKFKVTSADAKALLENIVSATTAVHGPLNTNTTLVLALADGGTENQLRKLLIDPSYRFNQELLVKNCEHMSNSGKITAILKLAKAGRGIGSVKEQDLYAILLSTFIKENNYTSALELFDRLESDDDLKISQDFLRTLVDLLRSNNLQIPSNLALRAQISETLE